MIFLDSSSAILDRTTHLVDTHSSQRPIKVAVAFWGNGASELFVASKTFSVICNLQMGGTNPSEIEKIRNLKNVTMLQHSRLHAKVVLSDTGAIVSSANFSSSGLWFGNSEQSGWIEAGIALDRNDPELPAIETWFDAVADDSKSITLVDLERAQDAWKMRSTSRSTLQDEKSGAVGSEPASPSNVAKLIRTLDIPGHGAPLFLRSAAALLALGGEGGGSMPYDAFQFLFAANGSAFIHHKKKFEIDFEHETVRLKPDYVGYFVGSDGTMENASDKKRRKVNTGSAKALSAWMMAGGPKPAEAEGKIISDTFEIPQ